MGVVVKHITEPVPEILKTLPSLPYDVDQVIKTSMAKDKTKRYATTVDLAKALNVVAFGNEGNIASAGTTGIRTGVFKPASAAGGSSKSRTGFAVAGVVILVALLGFFLLRNQLFPAAVPTATPTLEVATITSLPATEAVASDIPFAPACTAAQIIPVPKVEETNKVCVTKIPYTALRIPEGSTFTPLDPDLKCIEEATKDGVTVISCTGKQLFSYDLKVCTPSEPSNTDLAQCSADSTFNTADQCCAAVPPEEAGCTTVKIDIRACE
jgi:hypothetical protein